MYDPKSLKAEEFISHDEIMDTLAYAEQNKHNAELIDRVIEKAKLWKGLDHREASVLLACDLPDRNERIFKLAEQLKKIFTATALFCSRRCICRITVSTGAFTALTTLKTNIFRVKN